MKSKGISKYLEILGWWVGGKNVGGLNMLLIRNWYLSSGVFMIGVFF